jgi:hypothetical protein
MSSFFSAGGTALARYEYIRQADGRVTQVRELVSGALARTLDYVYDELGRLAQERNTPIGAGMETTDYVLDLVGNRLRQDFTAPGQSHQTRWRYDVRDRIIDEVFAVGGVDQRRTEYAWDLWEKGDIAISF